MSLQSKEIHHINLNSLIKLILYNYCTMSRMLAVLINMVKGCPPFSGSLNPKKVIFVYLVYYSSCISTLYARIRKQQGLIQYFVPPNFGPDSESSTSIQVLSVVVCVSVPKS